MWKVSRGISGQSHETDAGDGERGACGMHASFCGRSKHSGVHVDACRVHKPDLDYHPTVQWGGQGGTRCQAPHSASEPSVRSRSGSSSRSRLGQKALKIRFQYDPSLTSQIYLYAFIPSSLPFFFYILRISVILKSVSLVF